MPKQIKIGFDKVPSPNTTQFPQLVDIEGNLLFDEAGNPLLTEEQGVLRTFTKAENSSSVYLNNDKKDVAEIVPVTEVFPEQSAVSTNLLGYNRAETQLNLFADVSTYGYDVKNWNYYRYVSNLVFPNEWYTRENPVYGRRTNPNFYEETNEQALYLKSFPVQYTYPFGLSWAREGSNRYNNNFFLQYLNFIAMGKFLYRLFIDVDPVFANKNLISDRIQIIENIDIDPDEPLFTDYTGGTSDLYGIGFTSGQENPGRDVNYGDDLQAAFDEIERFTYFWQQIVDGVAVFPLRTDNTIRDFTEDPIYAVIRSFARTDTRPGYQDNAESFVVLESKNSFRYQPGRSSGFTFGTRMKNDQSSLNNYIEWGACNDTDQYVFQLRGSQFNIIRRSVIPLPQTLIERMGLPEEAVNNEYYPVGLETSQAMQEVTISRDFWNGDRLNGSGPSGYTLQFENVTMYKIEFSWYGAIGAKFYAYVPAQNGDARWVLMHTLVIENGMEEPILKNPDFKFRYTLYSNRTSGVTEPFYIYKYGSSYYIDGGDEGTVRLSTVTSDTKPFASRTPIIGVLPKQNIPSSYRGTEVVNNKKLYPTSISVNSDQPVRIDVEEVNGSSEGFHYHYSPGLTKEQNGEEVEIVFDSGGNTITYANNQPLDSSLRSAKVIADGIYNVYVGDNGAVERKSADDIFDYVFTERPIGQRTAKADGSTLEPREGETITARMSKREFAASTVPINSERFKIHFLNPESKDGGRHFADFLIGISDKEPFVDVDDKLKFGSGSPEEFEENGILDDKLFVEWSHYEERSDTFGREELEWDPIYGTRMEIDARLDPKDEPRGVDAGRVSAVICEVETVNIEVDSVTLIDSGEFAGLYKILFDPSASVPTAIIESSLGTGEIGSNGAPFDPAVTFAGPTGPGDNREFFGIEPGSNPQQYFVYVDGNPGTPEKIQLRSVTLRSPWILESLDQNGNERFPKQKWFYSKAFAFNVLPLYLVIGLRDGARVNNIVVEEEYPDTILTHTPKWLTGSNTGISVVSNASATEELTPSNFFSDTRLQGSLFDTQTTQPMRPGEVIYSFYVGANNPERIDLSNVFNFDRRNLSTGLYNNKAIFFTANQLAGAGNVEMTLTVKEQ
jgi:hypothetical protein